MTATLLASISALAMVADATMASAQPGPPPGYQGDQGPPPGDQGPPPGYQGDQGQGDQGPPPGYQGDQAPPQGQYAPPPQNGAYDPRAQQYDQDYAARYAAWANQNCVQQRANNTAAGAVIGGVLGAALGAGLSGGRAGATIVGGAVGASTGAAVGSQSATAGGCPPGYVITAGAPGFYYGGPVYPGVLYGPAWYNPWVFVNGGWVYRPYRSWYYGHRAYRGPRRRY